jgi:glycosyltransferase involved in cell wall biosynthesis
MASPVVTWLLPVRNAARYLPEALASMAAQTYGHHQVLAWDNGSTDATVDVLREWIPARLPGRIVADRPHAQLGACLAAMVEAADTELLARMDGDDVCYPERLAAQVSVMERQPDWVGCAVQEQRIGPDGQAVAGYRRYTSPVDIRFALLFTNPIAHPGVMLRRSKVIEAGNYSPLPMGQDLDLWFRLTDLGPFGALPQPLLQYRVHGDSIGARHHDQWADFQLGLLRQYGERVFPGAGDELLMAAAAWARGRSDAPGTALDGADAIMALARRAALAPAWRSSNFFSGRAVGECLRRCLANARGRRITLSLVDAARRIPLLAAVCNAAAGRAERRWMMQHHGRKG